MAGRVAIVPKHPSAEARGEKLLRHPINQIAMYRRYQATVATARAVPTIRGLSNARYHCTRSPGRLPLAGRLFPPQPNSPCEAAPYQGDFGEVGFTTCQEASRTDQGHDSETPSAASQEPPSCHC
jgi:hypothetical protein